MSATVVQPHAPEAASVAWRGVHRAASLANRIFCVPQRGFVSRLSFDGYSASRTAGSDSLPTSCQTPLPGELSGPCSVALTGVTEIRKSSQKCSRSRHDQKVIRRLDASRTLCRIELSVYCTGLDSCPQRRTHFSSLGAMG